MIIGVELRHVTLGMSGGITSLLAGVLERLVPCHPEHRLILFSTCFNRGLVQWAAERVEVLSLPTKTFFADVDRVAAERRIDVLFRSYPAEETPVFPMTKQVVLVPDIQHEAFPEFFRPDVLRARRRAFNHVLASAGAIATLSEFARQSIRQHPWTMCRDVFLMPPALRSDHGSPPSELSAEEIALIPRGEFFLYPANLWPHKNHRRILQAFGRFLKETGRAMSFVLTGHPTGWGELHAELGSLPVHHLGFVRTQLLQTLLQRARALVYFSLYEGFGMPLLEAFGAGTPVICSQATSLPEVGGDAVLTCDPTDVEAISSCMARIAEDAGLRADLVAKGKQRLTAYSWDQSVTNLLDACQRVAAAAHRAPARRADLPLVTIVTPSYNQGRFLRRTIESVLGQTYRNIEYIVVDGGSTDQSLEILTSYGQRFTWTSEPDRGQAHAINKGMARAKGEILAYLNSDDVLLPDAIEEVVGFLRERPEVDLVYGDADYIDEEDRVTGRYASAEYSFARLMKDCCICQPAAFWRRRIATTVGEFNEQLHLALDYEYWLRIDRAGGCIEHIPDVLARSRLYPETKTLSARRQSYEEIFAVCEAQGGYVSLSYFYGLWHHRINERQHDWARRLRALPQAHLAIGYLHHKWYHRNRHSAALLALARGALGPAARCLPHRVRTVAHRIAAALGARRAVYGCWDDNWLEPWCDVILHAPRSPGERLRLAGVAPVDTTLTIEAGNGALYRRALRAHQYEAMDFTVDPSCRRLTLHFSNHVLDSRRRRVSFQLMDTNLFSEHEAQ